MLHRVFIALNIPESVKTELLSYQEKWRDLPCNWTSKESFHITLAFLGNTSESELKEVSKILHEVTAGHPPFSVKLSHIAYGPSSKDPRVIWVEGVASKELLNLQKDIAKEFVEEKRPWTLHLTLGRLKELEFRRIDPEERTDVEEEISISFPVNSIEIMESKLKLKGAEYSIIESISL